MARLAAGGARFVAGEVTLVERPMSEHERYELSPTRTRLIFSQKGWSRVIGFHTRNVPHRVHEFIQLRALDMVHADGLYISPVIGPKKSGDFLQVRSCRAIRCCWSLECIRPARSFSARSPPTRATAGHAKRSSLRSVARTWAATTSS